MSTLTLEQPHVEQPIDLVTLAPKPTRPVPSEAEIEREKDKEIATAQRGVLMMAMIVTVGVPTVLAIAYMLHVSFYAIGR